MKNYLVLLIFISLSTSLKAESLSYSGRLVNANGSPVVGPVDLKFDLAYTNDPADIKCTYSSSTIALTNGVFHARLDLNCGAKTLSQILDETPAGELAAIRVTKQAPAPVKVYSFQELHSVPKSSLSEIAKQLTQNGATPGQILSWNGTKWVPITAGGGIGTVTSITAGTGLSGGTITSTGTIAIANGGVTDSHLAGNIARAKIANGTPNYVLVNDGTGALSGIAQLSLALGGTGAANATDARTNLGLGSAATAALGYAAGNALPADNIPVCLPAFRLQFTGIGPTYWSCVNDNDSLDSTKLPLAGGIMAGAIDMGNSKITNLATPTVGTDAATMAYVDTKVGGASQWTTTGSDIYYNTGKVGIGLSTLASDMSLQVESAKTDAHGRGINIDVKHHAATSGNYSILGAVNKAQHTIGSGVTNSGQLTGAWNVAFRNNKPGTPDSGTLAMLRGEFIQYGHYNSEATTPITTDAYGIYLSPHYRTGTITNMYDIYVHPGASGGTVTNFYGLYLAGNQKKNYFEGNLGLNITSPTEKLHVGGNQILEGKLSLKSDNANFVELKAPAGLAATLTFNLPGTIGTSGQALTTDGSGNLAWSTISAGATAVGGDLSGTVANAQIAAGAIVDADVSATAAIAQSKIANLTTDLASKQNTITAGTTAQYYRGDKSWQTLDTSVVPEGTNLYFLDSRVRNALMSGYSTGSALSISPTDSLLVALGKLEGQIIANQTADDNKWDKNGTSVYYNDGNVGIGTSTPSSKLDVSGTIRAGNATAVAGSLLMVDNYATGNLTTFGTEQSSGAPTIGYGVSPAATQGNFLSTTSNTNQVRSAMSLGGVNGIRFYQGASQTTAIGSAATMTEVMRITNGGAVGIGTSAPTGNLEVSSTSASLVIKDSDATLNSSTHQNRILFKDGADATTGFVGFSTSGETMSIYNYNDSGDLYLGNNGGPQLVIKNSGTVGVGTTSPVGQFSNWTANVLDSSSIGVSTGGSLLWSSSGVGYIGIVENRDTTASNRNGLLVKTAATDTNSSIARFDSGATTKVAIKADGKVGIGTATPTTQLEVVGNAKVTGNLHGAVKDTSGNALKSCVGSSPNSGWVFYGLNNGTVAGCAASLDIDTSACGFTSIFNYFPTLHGLGGQYITSGVTSIYNMSTTGFRVYVNAQGTYDGTSCNASVLPHNTAQFQVKWMGVGQ